MNYRNSELITWSDTFSCGVKLIDDQHKELVRLVNEMFRHVSGNEKQEYNYFTNVIEKAADYIKVHFSTEEKIMLTTKFLGYSAHKRVHDSFIVTVNEHIMGLSSGKRLSLFSFTKFLKEWVLSHIAVMDKQYFEYLRKTATRKANGKLTINSEDVQSAVNANRSSALGRMQQIA